MTYKIFWKTYKVQDLFSKNTVTFEGWSHDNAEQAPVGIFDSYVSAMADAMGLWDEYCEYHRTKL